MTKETRVNDEKNEIAERMGLTEKLFSELMVVMVWTELTKKRGINETKAMIEAQTHLNR